MVKGRREWRPRGRKGGRESRIRDEVRESGKAGGKSGRRTVGMEKTNSAEHGMRAGGVEEGKDGGNGGN